MDINGIELDELVSRVISEIQREVQYASETDESVEGTVALFSSFVPSTHTCARKLVELYGSGIDCALLNGTVFSAAGFFTFEVSDEKDRADLMNKLASAANIVLVAPKLSLLYRIAQGNDDGFIEQAFLRPLLWGREVTVLLDFDIPRFKRATFFERLVDSIDTLSRMGVRVESYKPSGKLEDDNKKALVTEADVVDAFNSGSHRIVCEPGAIITPLARDKAAELDVSIDW